MQPQQDPDTLASDAGYAIELQRNDKYTLRSFGSVNTVGEFDTKTEAAEAAVYLRDARNMAVELLRKYKIL